MSEQNYHCTEFSLESVFAIQIRKTQIFMNKLVYLGLSILELSKIVMYEFWYDYVKAKFGGKTKLCYLETECFSVYIKADDISKDIAKDVEKRFNTSNYELYKSLLKGKNKKATDLMKDKFGRIIMKTFVRLAEKNVS